MDHNKLSDLQTTKRINNNNKRITSRKLHEPQVIETTSFIRRNNASTPIHQSIERQSRTNIEKSSPSVDRGDQIRTFKWSPTHETNFPLYSEDVNVSNEPRNFQTQKQLLGSCHQCQQKATSLFRSTTTKPPHINCLDNI